MMHNSHETMPGFHPEQIWVDGCPECEHRAAAMPDSIGQLDTGNFARAWRRAGIYRDDVDAHVSNAERPLLDTIRAVQLQLLRSSAMVPGELR